MPEPYSANNPDVLKQEALKRLIFRQDHIEIIVVNVDILVRTHGPERLYMSEYTLQDCNITVPDVFRDRTMNLFTLSHTNANEFTFVISRATAAAEDTLQSVSQRLSSELQATLQDLSLNHARLTELSGRQALELFYSFKAGERIIFQKQRVVLTSENSTGKKLLCFIGTCPDAFDDYHSRIYDSITFPDDALGSPVRGSQIPADSHEIFFSFGWVTALNGQ